MATTMDSTHAVHLPPRWFIRAFWTVQRAIYRMTRRSLRPATADQWGMLALRTVGRRTGAERVAILGYFEDGPNLVTMAMNGWGPGEPAWWLNLQAQPEATVQTRDGVRRVRAHCAHGPERERLWSRWAEIDKHLDAYASRRPTETAVVVFEPSDAVRPSTRVTAH